jgi:ribosomal protein L17
MTTIIAAEPAVLGTEANTSAVSWAAIAGGAVASAGFSLFLLELGTGMGLSSISPWANSGASARTIGVGAGVGLVLISIMASALGGWLAGRLRTKWVGVHTDEVYFRDTAHGLMTWAFATVISASILATAATAVIGGAAQGAASNPGLAPDRNAYYVDSLFRAASPAAPADRATANAEAARILARAVAPGSAITNNDQTYLAQMVAARTGLSQAEAEKRVNEVITQAKMAADEARKAAAKLAFWMAAALLAGALASSFAAAEGGRERGR